jgi:hypothetical protein
MPGIDQAQHSNLKRKIQAREQTGSEQNLEHLLPLTFGVKTFLARERDARATAGKMPALQFSKQVN